MIFSRGFNLILISMLVFGALNLIENLIHYNIGRSHTHKDGEFVFNIPTLSDFLKILITMIVFGLAQGLLTELFVQD